MLQSKAGIKNREYEAQRALLADVDSGKVPLATFLTNAQDLLQEKLGNLVPAKA
jgi:pyruvate-ferredoxin/flavodoxin oxidoreductase